VRGGLSASCVVPRGINGTQQVTFGSGRDPVSRAHLCHTKANRPNLGFGDCLATLASSRTKQSPTQEPESILFEVTAGGLRGNQS
jgi:hypothetical protein